MADGAGGKEVGRISIRVVPNLEGFYRKLKSEIEKIEDSLKAKIQVEPDLGNFRQEVAAKTKGMRAKVKVDADVDRNFFGRIANKLDSLPMPSFGSGINPAGYAVIIAGILAVAAPLVGLLTTALLALPGILAAVLIPIGAIMTALGGLREATKGITQQFIDLSKSMTAPVQAQFQKTFDQLGSILPKLKDPLLTVTGGLADMLQGFTDVVTSGPGMAKIDGIIRNIGTALSAMKPGIASFTDGLLGLVEAFTSKMPDISEWFNGAGKSFSDWVTKMTTAGPDGVTPLDTAFKNLGGTIKTILEGLGKIADKGLKFMEDPEALDNFIHDLESIANLLGNIVELSDKINNFKIPEWMKVNPTKDMGNPEKGKDPWSGGFLDDTETAITNFFSGIWDNVLSPEGFAKIRSGLANFFTTLPSTIGGSITSFTDQVGTMLSGVGTSIASWFSGIWDQMKAAPAEAWANVSSTFSQMGSDIMGILSSVGSSIGSFFSNLWNSIVSGAQSAWGSITGFFSSIGGSLSGVWNSVVAAAANAWNTIVTAVQTAWANVIAAVSSGVEQVMSFISSLPGRIAAAAGNMGSALVGAGKALMDGLLSGIKAGLQAVLNFASSIASKIAAVKGPLPKDLKELIPAGEALMYGLGTGLENGLNPVLDQAKSIAKQIFEAFKETFGTAPQGLSFNLGQVQSGMQGVVDTSKDLNKAFAPTANLAQGSSLVDPNTTSELNLLKQQLKDLELQRKRLAVQKDQAGSTEEKKNIQGEIDRVNQQKRLLDLRKAELGTLQDQTGEMGKQKTIGQTIADMIDQAWGSGVDAIAGFGRANMDQAFSDLGIGGGALTAALDQGLDYGQKLAGNVFNFQVSSADDAIAIKNNQINKDALQYNRK